MAKVVQMCVTSAAVRHLYWRWNSDRFVTLCGDGNVILDGRIMTLAQATSILLKETGVPVSHFWTDGI